MPPETVPSAEQDHHFDDSVKDLNSGEILFWMIFSCQVIILKMRYLSVVYF